MGKKLSRLRKILFWKLNIYNTLAYNIQKKYFIFAP